jgi:hypothetical protein
MGPRGGGKEEEEERSKTRSVCKLPWLAHVQSVYRANGVASAQRHPRQAPQWIELKITCIRMVPLAFSPSPSKTTAPPPARARVTAPGVGAPTTEMGSWGKGQPTNGESEGNERNRGSQRDFHSSCISDSHPSSQRCSSPLPPTPSCSPASAAAAGRDCLVQAPQ